MSSKVTINRLATGVPDLDEVLGGGLPEFSFNLLDGPPGCGKTTLAHQIMFALATPERPTIYFTVLGESPLKMPLHQQPFDFFDAEAIQRSVRFSNLSDEALTGDLDLVRARFVSEIQTYHPTEGDPHNTLEQFVQALRMQITSWQAATFLIGNYFTETDPNPIFTVADCLMWLRQSMQRNSMVRKLEIMKMRGQPTLPGLYAFRICQSGVEVFAPAGRVADLPLQSIPPERLSMGVSHLDEMLSSGLPRGDSLLVAGPSASGKSILTAAFLVAGAACGEHGVIAAFEQHPDRTRNRVLADLIACGMVGLVDSRATDLSVVEIDKLQASAHSNELREFTMTESGNCLGGRLSAQEGLLGGRPTRALSTVDPTA